MHIDYFFRSLASDLREQAICIILSGTGADGTQGLRGKGRVGYGDGPAAALGQI